MYHILSQIQYNGQNDALFALMKPYSPSYVPCKGKVGGYLNQDGPAKGFHYTDSYTDRVFAIEANYNSGTILCNRISYALNIELLDADGKPQPYAHPVHALLLCRDAKPKLVEFLDPRVITDTEKTPAGIFTYNPQLSTWRSTKLEAAASLLGFEYELYTPAHGAHLLVRNHDTREHLQRFPHTEIMPALAARALAVVELRPGITSSELRAELTELTHRHVQQLIFQKTLWANLRTQVLSDKLNLRLYANEPAAMMMEQALADTASQPVPNTDKFTIKPLDKVIMDGKTFNVTLVEGAFIKLLDEDGNARALRRDFLRNLLQRREATLCRTAEVQAQEVYEQMRVATPAERKKGYENAKLLQPILDRINNGERITASEMGSRVRRFYRTYLRERSRNLPLSVLLMPKYRRRGNRKTQLYPGVDGIIEVALEEIFLNLKRTTVKHVHEVILQKCRLEKVPEEMLPSYEAVRSRIRSKPIRDVAVRRYGARGDQGLHRSYTALRGDYVFNGEYSMQLAHVDSTQVDVFIVDEDDNVLLGRPYLTVMMDAYSRAILGHYLDFRNPSAISSFAVVRDCYRRHGRLPTIIMTDNGSEFRNSDLDEFLRLYGSEHRYRPPQQPEYGAVIESFFRTMNTKVFHCLRGNNQEYK